jgi:hypothetical protein
MNSAQDWPDDVKRVKDEMDYHAVLGHFGWVAFKLADGSPVDHTAYETWNDAVRAAKWDRDRYMFLELQPDGMTYAAAKAVLDYARTLSKMGFRIPSPDADFGQAMSMPYRPRDRRVMARQLASGKPLYPQGFVASNLPSERNN